MSKRTIPGLTGFAAATPAGESRPLRVRVDTATREMAARLARDYTGREFEVVLAALVGDMAAAAERPGCWEHERVTAWLASHPWGD